MDTMYDDMPPLISADDCFSPPDQLEEELTCMLNTVWKKVESLEIENKLLANRLDTIQEKSGVALQVAVAGIVFVYGMMYGVYFGCR